MNKFIVLTLTLMIVIFSVIIISMMVVRNGEKNDETDLNDENDYAIPVNKKIFSENGYLDEGESYLDEIEITQTNIIWVNFSLHWVDEETNYDRYTNMPDNFSLEVEPPENSSYLCLPFNKVISDTGYINISCNSSLNIEHGDNIRTWRFNVTCVDAGNQIKISGFPGYAVPDNGNKFTLSITVTYLTEKN